MTAGSDAARRVDDDATIPLRVAVSTWFVAWLVGSQMLAALVIAASGGDLDDDLSIAQLAVAAAVGWAGFLVAIAVVSRRFGSGDPIADLAVRFRPIDLVGVPVGAATQFVLVPLLYLPLRELWPDTFSQEQVDERARDLVDRAGGWTTVLLVAVVVVGAPIVEELVYRGLLQRSATAVVGAVPGLVLTSLWFALIHLSPVQYPGLFLAGLVFGACVLVTGRVGPAIVTHAAFNAAGLVTVVAT